MTLEEQQSTLSVNVEAGYALGWSFTPLAGKRPTKPAWQKRPREELRQALQWADKGNVGLRTGKPSGVVVIDVDEGATLDVELPPTIIVCTGGGGYHYYYACSKPLGNSAGKLAWRVDVRGDGGQVVYPGSVHPETHQEYVWAEGCSPWDVGLAELPDEIYKRLTEPDRPKRNPVTGNKYATTALQLETAGVRTAPQGTRNDTLNTAAFNLGTLVPAYLDRATVEAELLYAAEDAGLAEREARATIRSGVESGMQHPREIPERTSKPKTATQTHTKQDYILIPGSHLTDQGEYIEQSNAIFANEVICELPEEAVYRRDYLAGEIVGEAGRRRWIEFNADRMRLVADAHLRLGQWVTRRKDDTQCLIYKTCTKDAAGLIIAAARQAANVRELEMMVSYPIYGPGFTRIAPGWHSGLFYDEPDDLQGVEPETDCALIHNLLHDLVTDFPFRSEADRQNFFGLMLTPIIAPALNGNRPLHLIGAPLERTGKTKLAEEVFGGVIIGRQTPAMQLTDRDEERDKRIIGLLLSGETLVHLDNLPPYVDSATLSSLLTATTYSGRILGGNRMVSLPNNLTIVASGNNVQASGEMIKRTVPIVLQPTSSNPESRRDFEHPDLRGFVLDQRRLILSCLLGLVENWIEAGKPLHGNPLGGFENWSGVVGGILQVNGLTEWRKNESQWRKANDPKGQEMEAFVELWELRWGANYEMQVKDLLELAEENGMFAGIMARPSPQARGAAFGKMMRGYADAPVGDWIIRWSGGRRPSYRLEEIKQ